MFNPTKKTAAYALSVMASAAVVLASAGAAQAAPVYYDTTTQTTVQQGAQIQPQTRPVTVQRYSYTRTETNTTPMMLDEMDNDTNYTPSTTQRAVTNPDNIRYLSGGIGHDEQMMLKTAEAQYPVKVVFANSNGAYVSDVDVDVRDSAGKTVLGLQTDGPVLLMDLKPGNYTLSANDGGEVKTQKLNVSGNKHSYTLHFKADEPVGYDRNAG